MPDLSPEETGMKPTVLNSGLDIKNTMSKADFQEILKKTFWEMRDLLAQHCGPFSDYAMVAMDDWTEPVFTKDGANLIRAFSYASKLQKIIAKNLLYLGDREEAAAGDGTTSAMILGADAIPRLIEKFKDCPFHYTVAEMEDLYKKVFGDELNRYLDYYAYRMDDQERLDSLEQETGLKPNEIIYKFAYLQAYTSSHGDKKLAEVVASFFAENPREVWDYTTIESEKYETEKDIYVLKDDAQFTIESCRLTPIQAYNKNLGTMYEIDEETEVMLWVEAPEIGIPEHTELIGRIYDAIEQGKKMCVIVPDGQGGMSGSTAAMFEDRLNKTKCKTVGFVRVARTRPDINDLVTLSYILGNDSLKAYSTKSWKAQLIGDRFYIKSGLYPEGTTGKNPYLKDEKGHQGLIDYLNLIDYQIKTLMMDRSKSGVADMVDLLSKYAIKIRTVGHTFVKLGGMQYDHLRNRDVVADAMIATRKALISGIVPGANATLKKCLEMVVKSHDTVSGDDGDKGSFFIHAIAEVLLKAIDYIQNILLRSIDAIDEEGHYYDGAFDFHTPGDMITGKNYPSVEAFLTESKSIKNSFIATEPVMMSKEFMKRFGDLALKFVNTASIIVPMSYYLPEEETKK